jgi:ABC-type methionine transport system ATPase subunit
MYVRNTVNILQNVQHMNRSARLTTLLVEDEMEFPGFTTLKLIAE